MKEYKLHPACLMFPPLDEVRLRELAESIKANGQRDPITLFDKDTILDGRNRSAASKIAGVEPKTELWDGKGSPYQFVLDKNARRRDLEADQRVAITLEVLESDEEWQAAQTAKQQRANEGRRKSAESRRGTGGQLTSAGSRDPVLVERTNEEIARRTGTSTGTVKRVKALRKADPKAFEKVKKGETKAHNELRGIKHAEARKKAADSAKAAPVRAQISKGDALDFLRAQKPASVDLLVTDPPYKSDLDKGDDIRAFARRWVPLALKCVKPTGRLYIFSGAYAEELHAYLSVILKQEDFTCANVNVWSYDNTIGPAPKTDYKLNWQAYYHLRGPKAPALDCPIMKEQFAAQKITAPDGRLGDRFHAWQKPDALADQIIRHASKEGDCVVDPFAGTGTFLLAAAKLGRTAIGCDVDDKMIKIARERGCELVGADSKGRS